MTHTVGARVVLGAAVALVALGCKDKACLRWTEADRAAYASTMTTSSSTSASSSSSGGAGGAGGSGSSSSGGSAAPVVVTQCPSRALAKELLGNPSCAEAISSIDSDGTFEDDTCCYEVTTDSKACPSETSQ